ncbi:aminoglycoside phosphotransferase family protein [Georgenia sp. Z1344]|uniref:aminoglycoside phosphotransferase family protein n=1 Tax=Georgenia sp. Z1344 TaxID=3416706 RepID=UPI003CEB7DA6
MDEEVPLTGGDVSVGVVRVGRTVRRPVGPHSPLVHAALTHLEAVGFDGAPRLHGVDDRGREILDFVDGEVAGRPWPAWVADEERGVSVARLVRRLDDAMLPLGLPDLAPAPVLPGPDLRPATFLGHRDVTPENVVFTDGRASALIDFDLVAPVRPVDEVVNLLLWWAAWMPVDDRAEAVREVDAAQRGRVLVDAYGLGEERAGLVEVAIATAERSHVVMHDRAVRLGGGWARMWFEEDVGSKILRRADWLRAHADELSAALTR